MADTDSFINEVSEEVRRDRLFALFRKWAWLAVLLVVAVVGAAAYVEWRRAQTEAAAQDFGDATLAALDLSDPAARIAALEEIEPPGAEGEILLALLAAGEAAGLADRDAAAARLLQAAEAPDLAERYRHLALLKAHMLSPALPDEARLILGALAEPGAPYAALAEEQLALLDLANGDTEAGLERLRRLEIAAEATPGLQQRAAQLIVAVESQARLVDNVPAEDGPEGAEDGVAPGGLNLGSELGLGGLELLPPGTDTSGEGASEATTAPAEDAVDEE
jgi:hypothetical protein